ncbi:hypothetical protein [Nitrosomonas sp.]|uniref:hypothetical protein n=1 Tax=Nitrosomonas sp. TaxID=42353 RepID=UPI002085AE9D|nr:hypothetical protein [Nitrosomonas sp.]GJL75496.1 MAG: hypothetical protein NMNS02_16020 [Nitrosomonas sp.]
MTNDRLIADKTAVTAITRHDLDEVAEFLHHHMNSRFTQQEWKKGISKSWLPDAPNFGFMLRCHSRIVGVLCAIYSEQDIAGCLKRFCNPHSWCVLSDFRARSIDLVLSLIRQEGYTFTMFSPNKDGVEIFKYLKFKPLDDQVLIFLNMPSLLGAGKILNLQSFEQIKLLLPDRAAQHYVDHIDFPWLNFIFFSEQERYGFLIFKKQRYKRLASAWIMYVSDTALFCRCWPTIRTHLLIKCGLFTSKIEARLLEDQRMKTWLDSEQGARKFFLSKELSADCIQNLYSELVTLDL